MAFKMNNAPFHKETKYLDDKTNAPKAQKNKLTMTKTVVKKLRTKAPEAMSTISVRPNTIGPPKPSAELQASGPGIGGPKTRKQKRKAKKNKGKNTVVAQGADRADVKADKKAARKNK
tara:strand:+ start:37 stop:390 length:354 start_codon:yes stop_codon:yes gene_type:complete